MKVVWKFDLAHAGVTDVSAPAGAEVVSIHFQQFGGINAPNLCVWLLVDPGAPSVAYRFLVLGTGSDVPDGWRHIGTAHDPAVGLVPPYVLHVFVPS